jgi:hypothetical protein
VNTPSRVPEFTVEDMGRNSILRGESHQHALGSVAVAKSI